MNESQQIAKFVSGLRYENLPAEVVARAKDLILDQVGIMMGVATLPWSKVIFEYVRDMGGNKPQSTIVHYGHKTNAENAVFANSSFGHGFEIDDLYIPGSSHPGCITVPSALAMGEKESISGKDLILAVVAGYEVMGRINAAITPSCALRGFHSATSITGPFGAATVAGKILGFGPELMLNALSIAGSHAAGVTEYDQGGGSVKRMHAGMAAHGGLRSALLAQKGLTGPPAILEGKHGFCKAFADEYKLEEITAGLGTDFRVTMGSCIKAYCACAGMHAGIDALRKITVKNNLKAGDIREIMMGTNRRSISHVAAEPTDITSAQFSSGFGLALTVIRGSNGFKDYTEETLRDPAILELAGKVKLEVDKEVDSEYPATRGARVTVKLNGGATYQEKVDYCKGTPQNPMTRNELEEKFYGLTSAVAQKDRADEIVRVINTLDGQKNISALIALLS
jgi:2-methylcitrate dehydratase PrpD